MSRRGAALFALMAVVWGLPYMLIKVAVRDLSPAMVVEARTAIAALVLFPLAVRQGQLRPLARFWWPLLAYTVAELAIPWYLLSDAERRLPSSLSGLLIATVPLIALLLAVLTKQATRFDRRGLCGLVVGLAGIGALLGLNLSVGDLRPVAEVGIVAVGYATGPLLASRYLGGLSSLALSAVSLAVVALAYLPVAAWRHPPATPPGTVIAAVVVLGLVCTALAFVAFFELIKEIGPTRATVITYLNPAVAVVLGVAWLGEPFTLGTGLGFVLILVGSWLATAPRATIERESSYPARTASAGAMGECLGDQPT
jgi:drug/metabolite transporter (DMT)-like permease